MAAHKCPKCETPIEKDEGCNHMSCTVCGHYFCWICGFRVSHWIHKNEDYYPLSCKYTAKWNFSIYFRIFLMIIMIPLLALMLFFIPFLTCTFAPIGIGYDAIKRNRYKLRDSCCYCFYILLFILLILICVGFGIGLGAIAGALLLAFGYIPILVIHFITGTRTIYWWQRSRTRTREVNQDNDDADNARNLSIV